MLLAQFYTSTEVISIIAAAGIFAGIVGGIIVNIITARLKREVAQVAAPMQETLKTAKVIEGHVNSEKMAADGREKTLTAENRLLREQLTDERQIAALLAAKVPTPIQVINGPLPKTTSETPVGDSATSSSLDRIDTNTEAIKDNTTKANDDGL